MDDTHAKSRRDNVPQPNDADPPADATGSGETLAALDPADAPALAEKLAAELAEDLEAAGAPPPEPTQLTVDIEGLPDNADR
jgi:hypothetical protein